MAEADLINIDEAILNQIEGIQKEVAETSELIGELEDVSVLAIEYKEDATYCRKAEDLAIKYGHIRRTRGDGNCFFRAFMFTCLERLINKDIEMKMFCDKVEMAKQVVLDLGYPSFTVEDFHDTFMEVVKSLEEEKSTLQDILKTFRDQGMSDYLVCYARIMTSGYLQKNYEFYLPFLENHADMKEFCSKEVEPMARESDHIHITALAQLLDIPVRVQYMDRGEGDAVNYHDFPEGSNPLIHLLYRPGHYDILYLMKTNIAAVLPEKFTTDVELVSFLYAVIKEPRHVSAVLRELGECYPLKEYGHLKRVKNKQGILQVLLWPPESEIGIPQAIEQFVTLPSPVSVPKVKPLTRRQFEECKKYWPTNFHENKSLEKKLSGNIFSMEELSQIKYYMKQAISEAVSAKSMGEPSVGAVIVDPSSEVVVAKDHPNSSHPLKHAVMVCIDRVAVLQGGGAWESNPPNQEDGDQPKSKKRIKYADAYLCTNYDLYTTQEPCVMCSMALLHSRIRRVFYGISNPQTGGLGSQYSIHCQNSLNHHFEVYKDVLSKECQQI